MAASRPLSLALALVLAVLLSQLSPPVRLRYKLQSITAEHNMRLAMRHTLGTPSPTRGLIFIAGCAWRRRGLRYAPRLSYALRLMPAVSILAG